MEAAHASEARRFGKYTLVAKLATGGMAEIFLARLHGDGGFEKLVCIKRILPQLARDPLFVQMFLDEARVAARISHPNVCQVFELGEWQGQYYIAMEYLEGVPLSVFRRPDYYPQPPDPRLVAGFGVQACEGLHHAHQLKRPDGELLGVIHRDISPQNLFATTDGIVKVLDFGIAKVPDASSRTSTGAVKGTYAYMAPEQLRNDKLDHRVDVWAVGVVLWESLTQRQLFKRETEFLTFEAITKLPIPELGELRPDLPPLFGDVLMRALARDPAERFPSARAFGEALAQAVAPLGGAASTAEISEEISSAFEVPLAEQRMLLRIAREGGQFDLDESSPLVGHGTQMSTTPVSNLHQRGVDAQAEVARLVAANEAMDTIEVLDEDVLTVEQPRRVEGDGAFTPAPRRRSSAQPAQPDRRSQGYPVQRAASPAQRRTSKPYAAQRVSQGYAAQRAPSKAAPRFDDTEPPLPESQRLINPSASLRPSRLPWLIAVLVLGVAAGAGLVLYQEVAEMNAPVPVETATQPIVMTSTDPAVVRANEPAGSAPIAKPAGSGDEAPAPKPGAEPPNADEQHTVDRTVEAKLDPKVEAKVEPELDRPKLEKPKLDRPKRDAKPVAKVEAKRAAKVEAKPAAKVEAKPAAKVEAKPAAKAEAKAAAKVEAKPTAKIAAKAEPPKVEPAKVSGPPGMITIDAVPMYAVIYIDGKKYGETPLVNLKLPPGPHTVRAVSPSGSTRTLSIHIVSAKTAPVARIEW